ncbi:JAB domain-containing protein [Rapidithrix thailandica]|uniref:JAB domain-containing protein n=1 Tax=Rapidithrix thailandica TaxID=413964 RepID=A0AAW9RRH1_9BACT
MVPNAQFQIAEIQVSYNPPVAVCQRPQICSSQEAYQIFLDSWDAGKLELLEQFKILLLNRANRVLGLYEVSSGGISETTADPKLIFSVALKAAASSLVLCHNHPSGNLKPSQDDLHLTQKFKAAGQLLGIVVLDHVILTREGYYSFADEGAL